METVKRTDVLVIGAGPAGLAAAIAAREDGVQNLLVLEREPEPGGILRQCIHNGFGLHRFKEELTGPEYAQRDIDRAEALGIPIQCGTTVLSLRPDRTVTCVSREHGLETYQAGAVVLAMGCRERSRGALNIPGYRPAGIYSAGTAQRLMNIEGLNIDDFADAIRDVINGNKLKVEHREAQQIVQNYFAEQEKKMQAERAEKGKAAEPANDEVCDNPPHGRLGR